ncbi:MAG: GspH/FimT family pseudopilin [Nitrospira sp.]|nr:GspH/FimT family pseudopilin [Nitrospira sp.]MDE0486661.1 GspH/FimT family pseudopilin [Nitrospira sp.]
MKLCAPRLTRPTDEPSGYTLTELMVVLGILGVVLGLSGTWLSSQLPYYRLNGVVRQIRADLLSARAQAVKQGNEVRVFFTDPQHYDILNDVNNNGRADPGEAVETRSIIEEFAGVTIESNNNPIFYPRGTASSLATVRVSNVSGEKKITIGITGRVKVATP